jgi:EasF-like predicted methyltransferase
MPPIIDIRRDVNEISIHEDIVKGLNPKNGEDKTLPTLLLYDEEGLKLFEKITYLDEYYLTNAEIEVLETYADQIAERIPNGAVVVELGSGNLRKINILLQAIDRAGKRVDYYALDLDINELYRTLAAVPKGTFKHVKCHGLHGTYDDGLVWLKGPNVSSKPKVVLSLGSSIGNFPREEVAPFLAAYSKTLSKGDQMIIGIDACKDHDRVYHAYNDRNGVTHAFIANGLKHANRVLGSEVFKQEEWKVIGEFNEKEGRHQAFVSPVKDVQIEGVTVQKGEKIRIEHSYKYSEEETAQLWKDAGLAQGVRWTNKQGNYGIHLLLV